MTGRFMRGARSLGAGLALALASVASAGAPAAELAADPQQTFDQQIRTELNVSEYTIQRLDVPDGLPPQFEVLVDLGGQPLDLVLERQSVRATNYQVLVDTGLALVEHPAPPVRTYRGSAAQDPATAVAASLKNDQFHAVIFASDGIRWGVQPVSSIVDNADPDLYVVYSSVHQLPGPWVCGGQIAPENGRLVPGARNRNQNGSEGGVAGGIKIAEIAFDCDVDFYNRNGSNVDNTVADTELILNGCDVIYRRDTQVGYRVTTIIVRAAEPDPYSSNDAGTLLGQFRNHWNAEQRNVRRDIAHLMTGKNINSSIIGIAYLSVICSQTQGYGLSESRFTNNLTSRVCLTAHELGHNWSAEHCDGRNPCNIMCSGLGGCSRNCTSFGTTSISSIGRHRDSRNCLDDEIIAIPAPLVDDFVDFAFNETNWTEIANSEISFAADNEPSPPLSSRVNGPGSLASNGILMNGVPDVVARFSTQHKGVENGETLVFEALSSQDVWVLLLSITSDGADQSTFDSFEISIPSFFLYDGVRFRFRNAGNEANDSWFIDNVYIGTRPEDPCPADMDNNGILDGNDLLLFLNYFFNDDDRADIDNNGVIDGADLLTFLAEFFAGC